MTNGWTDVANADVVLVMGGNPAENHPVGFRFVMEARRHRNAKLVVVDPRFNRTAAVADLYVPMRSGTDIAFLGGLIHYMLERKLYQEEYVRIHTNAPFLVKEGFGFEDGHFSGWDEETKRYEKSTWQYETDGSGFAKADPTLENPRCVFQLLKKHYSRYTSQAVANICGCTAEEFERAAAIICSTGKPDRSGTILYALGWTQHSHSVQLIHTAAMMQLLLGNIGMPGGGVNAQRGHSNIQGATDMGAWNYLPGYLKMPSANHQTLEEYVKAFTPKPLRPNAMNYWSNTSKFMVSLLKAYYGGSATRENGFGYDNLPKAAEGSDYSWGHFFDQMYRGQMEGFISFGMNPVANGPNSPKMLDALAKLKWMVVVENFETETAAFWNAKKLGEKYYPNFVDPANIRTEAFLLPAACFAEKDGCFVNSSRWAQWKYAAAPPPGDAKPDHEIIARIFLRVRELYRQEGGRAAKPLLDMTWDYATPHSPSLEEVAREVNGRELKSGKLVSGFGELKDDGTTISGNWLYSGSWTEAGNQMARRGQEDPTGLGLYSNWSWSWPANRRILYNRAAEDAAGNGWDPLRTPIRWDGERWTGDVPDYKKDARPTEYGAFIMLPEGVAKLFSQDLVEGPFPEHYEPVESPVANPLHREVSSNPAAGLFHGALDKLGASKDYPYVALTFRLTEHFHYWTKHVASGSELQSNFFVEVPEALAREKGIQGGDLVRVSSARGMVEGPALVTRRIRPLKVDGKTVYQVGIPIHWGFAGRVKGPLVNNLTPSAFDPNSGTPEYKGFLVNLEKA
ncbi:MAG: Formate dehydrogenase, nitrate-inducible, major subunit [Bryobacteraceae bacterium]|nr:Formate dehydrogenase, nitrate-inducible, major subunit [Bryobacteraceae bacterium]